jgi:hypothetical protein
MVILPALGVVLLIASGIRWLVERRRAGGA